MLSTSTRIRAQAIIKRLEEMKEVTLYERIYFLEAVSVSLFIRRSNNYFSDLLKLLFPKANNRIRNRFI